MSTRLSEFGGVTFAHAAMGYSANGGERRFLAPLLAAIGDLQIDEVNQQVVERAARMIYPHGTPATWNRQVFTPVLAVLNYAKVKHSLVRPHKFQRRDIVLDRREVYALLAACDAIKPEFGRLCRLLYWTNCRLSEALDLSVAAFDPQTNRLKLKRHSIELSEDLAADLARSIPPGSPRKRRLFRMHKGGGLYLMLQRAAREAKIELPPGIGFDIFRVRKVPQKSA